MEVALNDLKEWINKIGTKNLYIAGAVLVCLFILYFIIRSIRLKKYRKMIIELQNQMGGIKSLPIQYRLGRVKSIAKNTPAIEEQYKDFKQRYQHLSDVLKNDLAILMNEIDEQLYYGRLRRISKKMDEARDKLNRFEAEAKKLLQDVEEVTEVENAQRIEIIRIKEKYRSVCESYDMVRLKLDDEVPLLQDKFKEIDQTFISLEELMNHQEFKEAQDVCESLDQQIDFLDSAVRDLPTYVSISRKYLPSRLHDMQQRMNELTEKGFKIETMQIPKRYQHLLDNLAYIEQQIQNLQLETINEQIDEMTKDINDIFEEFTTEEEAYRQYDEKVTVCFEEVDDLAKNFHFALDEFDKLKKLYVFDDPFNFVVYKQQVEELVAKKENLQEMIHTQHHSYTELNISLNEINDMAVAFEAQLKQVFEFRDQLYLSEKRAIDELENINIVLLEIKSEIKNKHLPMISSSYKDYIQDSYDKADAIRNYCRHRPILLKELTQQVDEARDIIYKLYDNVHNLIVTAEMVEEAIVYGNRYRTSFLEVNTELTKAEVLFRNGEYTKALETCVDIIEKIEPGSYEKLIKKSKEKVLD